MSVDILPDKASTHSQQRGGFKDEGYTRDFEQTLREIRTKIFRTWLIRIEQFMIYNIEKKTCCDVAKIQTC
ncbi:hypothetical protein [Candidatus Regiella insecticola]|uniref:hypothetical protein n=1 Tax=Candidatus Regiella insecticola TaxID=138073 RepID=UPI001596429B|nr:hypothetical protein [Candidatus Regiella insecticola]